MKLKTLTILVVLAFLTIIYLTPSSLAFSGTENGYTVQGITEWVGGRETVPGYNVKFSGIDQPTGRANESGINLCLGEVCPTKPYVRLIGITPTNPRTIHVLDCGFTVADTDIEENVSGNLTWYLDTGSGFVPWTTDDQNYSEIDTYTLYNTTSQGDIEAADTVKSQQWKCSLSVTDGFYSSSRNSSITTIMNSPLLVHEIRTFLGNAETTEFETGEIVTTKVNVTDEDGRTDIDTVLIAMKDPDNIWIVDNESMTNTSQITDGYQYEYDKFLSASSTTGVWTINITANDTTNNIDTNSTTIIVFARKATVQFILTINDTESYVFIPGVGRVQVNDMVPAEYADPPHWYLSSELDNILRALVFQEREPISLIVNKTGFTHLLEINQEAANSKVYLVFTEGGQEDIENRIDIIESGDFLNQLTPTFGFGLGEKLPVKLVLGYDDIDVTSGFTVLQRGSHELVLESTRTDTQKGLFINQEL